MVLSGYAQNGGILVTKYRNQKSKFITEDSKIQVKSGGKTIKGRYTILSDSTILVNTDTISLKQIAEFSVKNLPVQLGGAALLLAGAYSTAGGIVGVIAATSEFGIYGFVFGAIFLSPFYVGGVYIAATGILLLVRGKKYASAKWKYKIVRPVPFNTLN